MDTLIVSQSIFYIVSSVAIIVLGIFLGMAIYQLLRILKNTRYISDDISDTYTKTKRGIVKAISSIFGGKKKSSK